MLGYGIQQGVIVAMILSTGQFSIAGMMYFMRPLCHDNYILRMSQLLKNLRLYLQKSVYPKGFLSMNIQMKSLQYLILSLQNTSTNFNQKHSEA